MKGRRITMLIISILLLIPLYFITSYTLVILYEKGASIFATRMLIIFLLILYSVLTKDSLSSWSDFELMAIGTIFIAHLFTVNCYEKWDTSDESPAKNEIVHEDDEPEYKNKSSFGSLLLPLLLISWLFHDDDNDDDFF